METKSGKHHSSLASFRSLTQTQHRHVASYAIALTSGPRRLELQEGTDVVGFFRTTYSGRSEHPYIVAASATAGPRAK